MVRLLDACKEILITGNYIPELNGERLEIVNDIRNGKYDYNFVLNYAEQKNIELDFLVSSIIFNIIIVPITAIILTINIVAKISTNVNPFFIKQTYLY